MSTALQTEWADVASWELSDSLWERIEPLLPKVKSRYRGRGQQRKQLGGRPIADQRKVDFLLAGVADMRISLENRPFRNHASHFQACQQNYDIAKMASALGSTPFKRGQVHQRATRA